MVKIVDGFMPFIGYKTYYKIIGKPKSKKTPVLVLHGGPGSPHRYLLGLSELAKSGRQVIFYDQLGGGKSSRPLNNSIWSFELFINELDSIRNHLKLDEVILYGHSWGGMLAAEYLCANDPKGVEKVILASAMISIPLYRKEVEILKKALPPDVYKTFKKHEKAGTTNSDAYQKAMKVYNSRHIFKLDNLPAHLQSPPGSFGTSAYEKLWGPSEAFPNGALKNWSRLDDLYKVTIPTLVISGQYDELTPAQAIVTCNNLPNSSIEIITGGTHFAHVEYPDAYLEALTNFIN